MVDHVRRPVRFLDGVRAAEALGVTAFLEVGPGGGLSAAVDQSLTTERPVSVVTMPKGGPEIESTLQAAGRLFTSGVGVSWPAVFTGSRARRVDLPTYGFARQRFWLGSGRDTLPAKATRAPDLAEQLHALPPRSNCGGWSSWSAGTPPPSRGTRAAVPSTATAPSPTSDSTR